MKIFKILLGDLFMTFAKRIVFTIGGDLTLMTLVDVVFDGLCMMKYSRVINIIENSFTCWSIIISNQSFY